MTSSPPRQVRFESGLDGISTRLVEAMADGSAERAVRLMRRWAPYYVVLADGTNLVVLEFPLYRRGAAHKDWTPAAWQDPAEIPDRIGLTLVGWHERGGPICFRASADAASERDAPAISALIDATAPDARYNDYVLMDLAAHLRISDRICRDYDWWWHTSLHMGLTTDAEARRRFRDIRSDSFNQSLRHAYRRWLAERGAAGPGAERFLGAAADCEFLLRLVRRMIGPARTLLDFENRLMDSRLWLALNGEHGCGTPLLSVCAMHPLATEAFLFTGTVPEGHDLDDPDAIAVLAARGAPPEDIFLRMVRGSPTFLLRQTGRPRDPATETAAMRALLRTERSDPDGSDSRRRDSDGRLRPRPNFLPAFALLGATPPDWHPRNGEDWETLFALAGAVVDVAYSTGIPTRTLVAGCGGRWTDWHARIRSTLRDIDPAVTRSLAGHISDVLAAFAAQVLLPCLALSDERLRDLPEGERTVWRRIRPAASLLFGEASLNGIAERCRNWHRSRAAIEATIERLSTGEREWATWPAGLPEMPFADGGLVVRPLTSRSDLVHEGRAGPDTDGIDGLDHCVGGFRYAHACLCGEARILSIRTVGKNGTERRLSTAELRISRHGGIGFELVQHRGAKNAPPPDEAASALALYLAALATAPVDAAAFAPVDVPGETLSDAAGYDVADPANVETALRLWEPVLPKRLRRLTLDDFAAAARAAIAGTTEKASAA